MSKKKSSKKTTTKTARKTSDPDLVPLKEAMAPKKTTKEKKLSLLDAAAQVLKAKGEPMTTGAMVEAVRAKGLWDTKAPTPAATLYSAILRDLKKGKDSRFKKSDRGLFVLNG